MKSRHEDADAFAHGPLYLCVRRFVRQNIPCLIRPWTLAKRFFWSVRYPNPAARFAKVHEKNYWASSESRSGEGSTLEATTFLRQALLGFIARMNIKSMLDIPCGDFNWMQHVGLGIPYLGGDIVEALIRENQVKYAHANRTFQVLDLTNSALPANDLVLTRDCLNHLSLADIRKAVANVRSSGSIFWAVTQFPAQRLNRDQESGFYYREINFQNAPFYWPPPIETHEEKMHPGKHISFWRISDLPAK
jgi:hypothetical protein